MFAIIKRVLSGVFRTIYAVVLDIVAICRKLGTFGKPHPFVLQLCLDRGKAYSKLRHESHQYLKVFISLSRLRRKAAPTLKGGETLCGAVSNFFKTKVMVASVWVSGRDLRDGPRQWTRKKSFEFAMEDG